MDALAALSPKRLRRYRQITQVLVRHGFGFLFARLREGNWDQEVEAAPSARHLALALEELGPTFIKLGQLLSTRPDLIPPQFVAELARLQDQVAPFPFEQVRELVEQDMGAPLEQLFASVDEKPLAAASLSQVHAATLAGGEEVVIKVQRPGIQDVIATDLEILRGLARLAEEQVPLAELYDLPGVVEEFAHTLRGELDFRREGHNADRLRHNFEDKPVLYIPTVYWELTTSRVLTLERIRGIKIDDVAAIEAAGLDRHRAAAHATEIVMQEVFVDGFFHADPHPGNFFVMPGEVIAAIDFGMVGHLSHRLREDLVLLFFSVTRLETEAIVDQLLRMSLVEQGVDRTGLRHDLEGLLRRYVGRPLKEVRAREILEEAIPIAFRRRLRLPAELWLLAKMVGMLEGVGVLLDPDFDPFSTARPYAQRFLQETLAPAALLRRAAGSVEEWAALLLNLPTALPSLASRLRQGNALVGVEFRQLDSPLDVLDHLSTRLTLAVLVAALLVVAALLIRPLLLPGIWWGWLLLATCTLGLMGLLGALLLSLRRER